MHKKWLKYFFIFCMSIILILEINYQYNRKNFIRHGLDHKIKNILPKSENKRIDTILFGTSVTYGPIRKYKIKETILDLSTVHSVGILGQYFMLRRYLKTNRVDNIYLFVLPQSFDMNLSGANDLYIESVFDQKEEKEFLKNIRDVTPAINYFYSRINYLKFWKSTYRYFDRKVLKSDWDKIIVNPAKNTLKFNKNSEPVPKIGAKVNFVFDKFIQLCTDNNINLVVVIEPITDKEYQNYQAGGLSKYIQSHHIELIEFNAIHTFEDKDFFDGRHLDMMNAKKYIYLIDQYIFDLL